MKKTWMYFVPFFIFANIFIIACSQTETKGAGSCSCRAGISAVCQ